MSRLRYLEDVVSLAFDAERCTGCRLCTQVCPHGVFTMAGGRAAVVDRGACMECGACALNCASGAITVESGVGCATAIIASYFRRGEPTCGPAAGPGGGSASGGACC